MKPVTDPALLAQLNGSVVVSEGQKGLGSREAKTAEEQRQFQQQGRMVLRGLAQAEGFNQQIAPGRFKARTAMAAGELPSGWQEGFDVPLFQMMEGVTNRLVRPAASALAGRPLGVSETNQPSELEAIKKQLPSPMQEQAANSFATTTIGKELMERLAREKAATNWRTNYGSVNAKNKAGQTFEDAWGAALASGSPQMQALRNFDMAAVVRQNLAKRRAQRDGSTGLENLTDAELRKIAEGR